MRQQQIKKIKKKKLKSKYSCFELEELAEEIKEYNTLLKSIGIDIDKKEIIDKKNIKT